MARTDKNAWDAWFLQLQRFREQFGHCDVGRTLQHKMLAKWLSSQVGSFGGLQFGQLKKLYEIGAPFRTWDRQWLIGYFLYAAHVGERGRISKPTPQLRSWIDYQRLWQHRLALNRWSLLEKIGFDWKPTESLWQQHYRELVRFKKQHGHCIVPRELVPLGKWVQHQRAKRRELLPDKRRLLNALSFEWDPRESAWKRRLNELKDFKKRFGHCAVPENWRENPALAHWVSHLRQRKKKGLVAAERVRELNRLGFEWVRR